MASMGRRNRRARTSTRAPRSATRGTRETHTTAAAGRRAPRRRRGRNGRARLPSSRARRCAGEVPSAEETRAKIFVDVSDIPRDRRRTAERTAFKPCCAPTALPPPGGRRRLRVRASPARARPPPRAARALGAADARARDGSTSILSRCPRRVSPAAPYASPPRRRRRPTPARPAPPTTPTRPSRPRRVCRPAPRAGLRPACPSPRSRAWRARGGGGGVRVLFNHFHLRHYTLSLKALYLEVFSFAIVGAAAFWVVKTALAEAQGRRGGSAAAADDSLFAAIDGWRALQAARRRHAARR